MQLSADLKNILKEKLFLEQFLDEREIEFATTFIFNGAIGVINYWVQNEFMDSVDDIARIIEELSYNGIKSYLYNEKNILLN